MKDDSGLEMHNHCGNFDEWKNRTEQTSLIFDYLLLNYLLSSIVNPFRAWCQEK